MVIVTALSYCIEATLMKLGTTVAVVVTSCAPDLPRYPGVSSVSV